MAIVEHSCYGVISEFAYDCSAYGIKAALQRCKPGDTLRIRVHSPGGDPFEATAMRSLLESCEYPIEIMVDGLAASAASVLLQCNGAKRMVSDGAYVMIHRASVYAEGNSDVLSAQVQMLNAIDDQTAELYARRSGKSIKEVSKLMAAETWMGAADCVEMGFADEVVTRQLPAASMPTFNADVYTNAPMAVQQMAKGVMPMAKQQADMPPEEEPKPDQEADMPPEEEPMPEQEGMDPEAPPPEEIPSEDGLLQSLADATGLGVGEVLTKLIDMSPTLISALNASANKQQQQEFRQMAETGMDQKRLKMENDALARRVAELEKAEQQRKSSDEQALSQRVTARVDQLIESGFVLDADRKDWEESYRDNWQRTEQMAARLGRVVPVEETDTDPADVKESDLTEVEQRVLRNLVSANYKKDAAIKRIVEQRKRS